MVDSCKLKGYQHQLIRLSTYSRLANDKFPFTNHMKTSLGGYPVIVQPPMR